MVFTLYISFFEWEKLISIFVLFLSIKMSNLFFGSSTLPLIEENYPCEKKTTQN